MNSTTILIIAAVFGGSFLMMIPIYIARGKKKKKVEKYKQDNTNKALLHVYGRALVVDGRRISDIEHIRGNDLEYIVPLSAGKHTIEAKYETTSIHWGKNVNFKMPKAISSEIEFEAGGEYTIAVYFYSPEERREYYNGDVGESIYSETLDVSGGGYTKAYIICYKE